MSVEITWERFGDLSIAVVAGRLDATCSDMCEKAVISGIGENDLKLILDFEKLSYISSAGLRVILSLAKRFTDPGKKMAICSVGGSVEEIVSISGLPKFVSVFESRAAAISDLENY